MRPDSASEGAPRFRFACQRSGRCCTHGEGRVWLDDGEAERLASALSLELEPFVQRYARRLFDPLRGGPCYSCLYEDTGDDTALNCSRSGVLAPLVGRGLLERDANGRYGVGLGLMTLGLAARGREPVAVAAKPLLEAAAAEIGETFFLVVARGGRLIVTS